MIHKKTFSRMFFIYRYLRDHLIQPARVDLSDNSFIALYIKEFNPKHEQNLFGIYTCSELEGILNSMCSKLILQRSKIALNPFNRVNNVVWSYSLTTYAEQIISNYQDYFLNLLIRQNTKNK